MTADGTFAPRPGAAPLHRMVLAQAAMEARLLLRNGEQVLLALVIPLLVLFGGVVAIRYLDLSLTHSLHDPRYSRDPVSPACSIASRL